MTLQWSVVFFILVFEMAICLILVLPLPLSIRKSMWKYFATSSLIQKSKTFTIFMAFVLAALFIDAYRESRQYSEGAHAHIDTNIPGSAQPYLQHQSKYFRAQRNMYISGFTLFLGLILYRFIFVLADLYKIQENAEIIHKQAKNQQDEYKRITDELSTEKKRILVQAVQLNQKKC